MPPDAHHAPHWQQLSVTFADPPAAEHYLVTHLGPAVLAAEAEDLITAWFFIRKRPWRLRYLAADTASRTRAAAAVIQGAHRLRDTGAARISETIYEPETHAFGGPAGMDTAHRLFHADSRNLLAYLGANAPAARGESGGTDKRRELSLLLCAALMRAAGMDRYEQGDVWARLAAHRSRDTTTAPRQRQGLTAVQRLTTVDTAPGTALRTGTVAFADAWLTAFETAGAALRDLSDTGHLTRGLRAVVTHHILFHWNRLGLAPDTQSALAHAACDTAFADPRERPPAEAAHTSDTRGGRR